MRFGIQGAERPQRPPRWRFGLTQLTAELYADDDGGDHAFSFGVRLENEEIRPFSIHPIVDSPLCPFHSLPFS